MLILAEIGGGSAADRFFKLSERDNPASSPTRVGVKKHAGFQLLSQVFSVTCVQTGVTT